MAEKKSNGPGILGIFGILVGLGVLLVALISVPNTLFDLHLALKVGGSRTKLPDSWGTVGAVAGMGGLILVLSAFGTFVMNAFRNAKGRPLVRVAILVGAAVTLTIFGRAVQVLALTMSYGSMLAYYATYEDVSALKGALASPQDAEDLDAAVSRAAQYDNEAALALLLDARGDLRAATKPEDRRRCLLTNRSTAFVKVALDHGVTPATCPNSEDLIWQDVKFNETDAETAQTVALLLAKGWSATVTPEPGDKDALTMAKEKAWPLTAAALAPRAELPPATP